MSNPSKRKGTDWEVDVVAYFQEHGYPFAERRTQAGKNDRGDIAAVGDWCLEAKAEKTIRLASYMNEVAVERNNAKTLHGAAIVKRRGKPVERGYVVMDLETFAALIRPKSLAELQLRRGW